MDAIDNLLHDFHGNGPTQPESLDVVETTYGYHLPDDYRHFMTAMNGGEGFVGKQYIIVWRLEELVPFNRDYQVAQYAPGLVLFASSGGGEAFAFDLRHDDLPIVQVPFVGLDLRHAKRVANSFTDLLVRMHSSDGSLL
jgi:SMI1 / KNR4 family (SUKH-1)